MAASGDQLTCPLGMGGSLSGALWNDKFLKWHNLTKIRKNEKYKNDEMWQKWQKWQKMQNIKISNFDKNDKI